MNQELFKRLIEDIEKGSEWPGDKEHEIKLILEILESFNEDIEKAKLKP